MSLKGKTILLGVTGGIAAYRVCDLIRRLKEKGATIKVIMTRHAKEFITPLTLEALSGHRVFSEGFELGVYSDPLHTHLAKEADLLLICPASADVLAKMSHGLADDLLTTVYLATVAKVCVVPAMNNVMYRHAATQDNLLRLKQRGTTIVDPVAGKLVCGDTDMGHIAGDEEILKVVEELL
jgi:phosphopantothenoylcysteine decarboxylase/phosphopantothenate--cysteine ligase